MPCSSRWLTSRPASTQGADVLRVAGVGRQRQLRASVGVDVVRVHARVGEKHADDGRRVLPAPRCEGQRRAAAHVRGRGVHSRVADEHLHVGLLAMLCRVRERRPPILVCTLGVDHRLSEEVPRHLFEAHLRGPDHGGRRVFVLPVRVDPLRLAQQLQHGEAVVPRGDDDGRQLGLVRGPGEDVGAGRQEPLGRVRHVVLGGPGEGPAPMEAHMIVVEAAVEDAVERARRADQRIEAPLVLQVLAYKEDRVLREVPEASHIGCCRPCAAAGRELLLLVVTWGEGTSQAFQSSGGRLPLDPLRLVGFQQPLSGKHLRKLAARPCTRPPAGNV
ncbi:hypothetical protein VUR80DRAFT_6061 [Thermomyces stellatus]